MTSTGTDASSRKIPQYARIAADIRDEIKVGNLKVDDPVPSAAALCEKYGVSMITAKNALNLLRAEGVVYGVAGKGTFVAKMDRMIRTVPYRYFEGAERTYVREAERAGRTPDAAHETEVIPANDWVAQRLEINSGDEVVATTYRVTADGRPMSMSTSWEPRAVTEGTAIELPHVGEHATKGLNGRFSAIGWTIEQVEEHLIIRQPSMEEAEALTVAAGVPVVEIRQTIRASKDGEDNLVAVEAADIIFPADRYEFHYLMDRPH
ncbi:MAG: GntR family transcriptional regulator [Actinomycetota bacterium]|jgi:GntR family transcriptional regulator|nr:GntR family transcriptional regulator [Actinomycetota bacterium]